MASERERMVRGELYDADDPELVAERKHARELTNRYNRSSAHEDEKRHELLEALLGTLGEGSHVEPPFRCDYGANIHVGENWYANVDCVVLDVCSVTIGRNCLFGPSVHIYTATHPLKASERADGREYGKPVTIGDDVWIGGRAIVNPGVTIGDNVVVGSGAVVTADVPDGVVVQGNPARVVKELETDT